MWFDETNLTWVNPSPNMRNLTQATLYPCTGLLEGTNISVGRGTDQPFETFGAPWIDGRRLAGAMNDANLPGLRFVPIEFTPASSKFKGEKCQGVYVIVTDREAIQPVISGLAISWHLKKLFGRAYEDDRFVNLLQNRRVFNALKSARDPMQIESMWKDELDQFKSKRAKYLMYK
jgi:uncharacterized protein YbbC (DUF1343 family)